RLRPGLAQHGRRPALRGRPRPRPADGHARPPRRRRPGPGHRGGAGTGRRGRPGAGPRLTPAPARTGAGAGSGPGTRGPADGRRGAPRGRQDRRGRPGARRPALGARERVPAVPGAEHSFGRTAPEAAGRAPGRGLTVTGPASVEWWWTCEEVSGSEVLSASGAFQGVLSGF